MWKTKLENCYEKTVKYPFDFGRIDFLRYKKVQTIKEKSDKFNYIKIKNICSFKINHKRQVTNWEKIFTIHIIDKVSRVRYIKITYEAKRKRQQKNE